MTAPAWNLVVYAIAEDRAQHESVHTAIDRMEGALTSDRCRVVVQCHTASATERHWLTAGKRRRVERLYAVDPDPSEALTSLLNAAHRGAPAESTALILFAHGRGLDDVHQLRAPARRAAPVTPRAVATRAAITDVFDSTPANLNRATAPPGAPVDADATLAQFGREERGVGPRGARAKWARHWARDPRRPGHLRNVDLRRAIETSVLRRVQVLGLNACWMASIEVAYELREVAEIQLASQVYATAWPYASIVHALVHAPPPSAEDFARVVVAAVRAELAAHLRSDTLAAIRAGAALDAVAAAFTPVAQRARALIAADWLALRKLVDRDAQRLPDPYQVDLQSLAEALGRHDPETGRATVPLLAALTDALIAVAATDAHPGVHGLSVLCPRDGDVDLVDAYKGIAFREHTWARFLAAYQTKLNASPRDA